MKHYIFTTAKIAQNILRNKTKTVGTVTSTILIGYEIGSSVGIIPPIPTDFILNMKSASPEDFTLLYDSEQPAATTQEIQPIQPKKIQSNNTLSTIKIEKQPTNLIEKYKYSFSIPFDNLQILKTKDNITLINTTLVEENNLIDTTSVEENNLINTTIIENNNKILTSPVNTNVPLKDIINKTVGETQYIDYSSYIDKLSREIPQKIKNHAELHKAIIEINTLKKELTASFTNSNTFIWTPDQIALNLKKRLANVNDYVKETPEYFTNAEKEQLSRYSQNVKLTYNFQYNFPLSQENVSNNLNEQRNANNGLEEQVQILQPTHNYQLPHINHNEIDNYDIDNNENNNIVYQSQILEKPQILEIENTPNSQKKVRFLMPPTIMENLKLNDADKETLIKLKNLLEEKSLECNETTEDAFLIQRRLDQLLLKMEADPQYKLIQINEKINMFNNYQNQLQLNVEIQKKELNDIVQPNLNDMKVKIKEVQLEYANLNITAKKALKDFKLQLLQNKYWIIGATSLLSLAVIWYKRDFLIKTIQWCSKIFMEKSLEIGKKIMEENKESSIITPTPIEIVKDKIIENNSPIVNNTSKLAADVALKLLFKKSKIFKIK